jgi:hypothetical protein
MIQSRQPVLGGRLGRLAAALAVGFAISQALVGGVIAADHPRTDRPVRVMTRNLYLGADLTPAVTATSFQDLAVKVAQIYGKVQATDFPARATVLAREIGEADPTIIGLQEVALWRTGAPGVLDGPVTPATTVAYDFLALLQAALAAAGTPYDAAVVQQELDVEVPSALGFDVRLTQRDVILVKAGVPGSELTISGTAKAIYATNLVFNVVGNPVVNTRGWTSVDVTANKRTFRLVNTHLEAFSAFHRWAQAGELLAAGGPTDTGLPVILLGDLNSAPTEPGPFSAYARLTAGGFRDTWLAVNASDPGYTCCNAEDLLNPTPTMTQRIDHILVDWDGGVISSRVVGIDPDNRTPSGLWPSDHAGVVAALQP